MAAPTRTDRGKLPGTQTSGSPEGAVADGQMTIVVEITIAGTPAAVQADYNTIAGTSLTAASSTIKWRKR